MTGCIEVKVKYSFTIVALAFFALLSLAYLVYATTDTVTAGDTQASISYIATGKITASASGTSQTVGVKVSGNGNAKVAIYSKNATGGLEALLGESADTAVAAGWNDITLAGVNIVSGTDYWLATKISGTNGYYDSGLAYDAYWLTQAYGAAFPSPAGSFANANPRFALRITYEAAPNVDYNYTNVSLLINGTSGNKRFSYGDTINITVLMNVSGYADVNISVGGLQIPNYTAPANFSYLLNFSNSNYFSKGNVNNTIIVTYYGNQTQNKTSTIYYIFIDKANTSYTITADRTSPQYGGTTFGIECRGNVSQNPFPNMYMWRNGTEVNTSGGYNFVLYNDTPTIGTWRYYCGLEYAQNYTSSIETADLNFTINPPAEYAGVNLWLNGTNYGTDTCTYPCAGRNFTVQSNVSGLYVAIYRNGTLLSNQSVSGATNVSTYWSKVGEFGAQGYNGWWNITARIFGNASFGGSWRNITLSVGQITRTCTVATDKTWSRIYDGTASSTTCDANVETEGSAIFQRNGTTIGVGNPDSIINAGWYAYSCGWSVSDNYTACSADTDDLFINKSTIQPYILVNSSRNTYHSLRDGANPNTIMGWEFGAFDAPVWLNMSFAYLPNLPAGDVGCSIAYSNQVKGTSWITYLGSGGLDYLKANCTETTNVFANSTGENVLLNTGLTRANSYPRILLNNTVANWTMLPNGTYYKPTFKMGETLNISCSYTATDNSFSLPNSQIYGDINKVVEPNCYLTGTNATGKGWILQTFPTLTDPYDMLYYSKVYDNSTIITGNATGQVAILHIISKNHTYPYLLVNGSAMDYLPHYTYGAWLNLTCMNGANPNNSEPVCSIMNESSIDVGNSIMLYRPADVTGAGNTYKAYIPNETISYLSNSTGQVYIFIIDKSSDVYPYILINGSRIFTFIANDWVNISCDYSSNPPSTEPSCTISRDGVVKGTSEQVQLSEGAYLITANSSATPNYTANNIGESMILSTGPPISVNLDMQASNPACGGFYPSLGLHNYTVYSVVNISVYPYCKFWYWNITSKPQIYDTSFNLLMNGNYTVKAYFNTTGQDATAGGGISANDTGAVAAVLNPFLAGYMMLALFHLAIAGVAVYVTKSAVFGIGVFFLFLLVFLAGGLYPSAIWAIVIAIVAIIMTMIMAKIRGGQS